MKLGLFICNKFSINVASFTKSGLGLIKIFLLKISGSSKQSKLPKILPALMQICLIFSNHWTFKERQTCLPPSVPSIPSGCIRVKRQLCNKTPAPGQSLGLCFCREQQAKGQVSQQLYPAPGRKQALRIGRGSTAQTALYWAWRIWGRQQAPLI